ncbi:ATP-binding cassette sub-family B member 10, mitochondrial, partial [Pseudolycoriella hygida]
KFANLFNGKRRLVTLITKRFTSTHNTINGVQQVVKESIRPKRSDFYRLLLLGRKEKWIFVAAMGCLLVSSSITMGVPYSIGRILDIIFTEKVATEKLKEFCLILVGVFVIGGLANFGRIYLMNGASLRIIKEVRAKVYRTMINQEAGWFDTKGTGELVNRLSNDTYIIGNSFSQNLSDGLRSIVTICAGTTMMIYTSPELAFVSMGVVPCIAGLAIVYGRYVRSITRQILDKYAEIMKTGEERLNNIKTVKMFCKEEYENRLFDGQLIDALKLGYKDVLARATFYGLTGFTGNIVIISVLYYGGTLVTENSITIGALTSFILYSGYTALSLSGLGNFYTEINKGIGAATRIWEIVDRKYEIPVEGGLMFEERPKGEIVFKDVVFSFPSRPRNPIINNMSLSIKPRTVTAIVGRSGSGKTTIATLLLRLYDPQVGSITLDGKDLRTLNPTSLRSHIGTVNQEPVLFSGTIRENILYGLNTGEEINEDDFQRVVKEAHVDEFVKHLPNGMETMVGQRGMMLSGGQKQRVAIARALIRNPSILILDEATSALDAVSESLIQNSFDNLSQGRTVLTIAHRLSTIRNAQNICVLQDGHVAEFGPYEELLAIENGVFKNLVQNQTFDTPCHVAEADSKL